MGSVLTGPEFFGSGATFSQHLMGIKSMVIPLLETLLPKCPGSVLSQPLSSLLPVILPGPRILDLHQQTVHVIVGLRQPKGTWQCTKKTLSLPPQSQQFGDSVGRSLIEGLPAEGKNRLRGWGDGGDGVT